MLRNAAWSAVIWRRGYRRHWRELDTFDSYDPGQAKFHLALRLQAQVRHFGSRQDALPEWREAARIADPLALWRCWPELPLLTKDALRNRFDARELRTRTKMRGVVSSTGGSTGEPVWYFHDDAMIKARVVTNLYSRLRMGWRPGMRTICVWGSERDIGRRIPFSDRAQRFIRGGCLVDGYNLRPQTAEKVVQFVRRHKPVALYGFTSMLEYIARYVLKAGIEIPDGAVAVSWNGGEMLLPSQAEVFRKAFKIPLRNLYGGRELGAIAYQAGSDTGLSVMRPYVFVEIVDKNGRPAAPGETGRVIVTSTICRGTPFMRYEIGDVAAYSSSDCDESGLRSLSEVQGRTAGLFELPNGKVIHCLYWNHLLKDFSEVHRFQAVLRKNGTIDLLLSGDGFSGDRESRLRSVLQHCLSDVPVQVSWVQQIPVTPRGKLVQVVRE